MSRGLSLMVVLACLALGTLPASAQEVTTILHLEEWRVAGVCVGVDQCGFCWISNSRHQAAFLDVKPPREVSAVIPNSQDKAPVGLEIGQQSFTLTWKDGETFRAEDTDGSRIIEAMRHTETLTLRVGSRASAARYQYSLAEFPRVYAALSRACRIPQQ
jgi:hypothetical protein